MYLEKERHQTLDNFLSASFSKLTRIFKISFEVRVYFITLKKFYSTYSRKKQLFNLSFTLAASVNYPHVDPLWTPRSHTEDIKQISKLIELCLSILLSALCCIQPQTQQKKKKKNQNCNSAHFFRKFPSSKSITNNLCIISDNTTQIFLLFHGVVLFLFLLSILHC